MMLIIKENNVYQVEIHFNFVWNINQKCLLVYLIKLKIDDIKSKFKVISDYD